MSAFLTTTPPFGEGLQTPTLLHALAAQSGITVFAETRSHAGPIRVRAEIPSVTRKRVFLNHANWAWFNDGRFRVATEAKL